MRKIVVLTFVSLDGVMQAPGGTEEDKSNGFKYGGWTFPYFDDAAGEVMAEQMGVKFDLLLGRKTYDLFASYWPKQPKAKGGDIFAVAKKKYVVSKQPLKYDWEGTVQIKDDVVNKLKALKREDGPMIQVYGSGNFIQTLLKHDLVDELWLKIFPVTLGSGKRLFAEGTIPAAFKLIKTSSTPSGIIIANYKRGGKVKTGTF